MESHLTRYLNDLERCSIVCEVLSGQLSRAGAVKKYGIGSVTLYRWIRKFASPSMLEMENKIKGNKPESCQEELSRLREEVRALRMKSELYDELFKLAKEHYDIDILKNFGPKQ